MSRFVPLVAALHEAQLAFLQPRLEELGITLPTFQLLLAVAGGQGRASQADVARRLGVSPATLSEAVAAQRKAGLVEQVPVPEDRRIKLLRLTKSGENRVAEIRALVQESQAAMLKGIAAAKVETACAVLERALANLEKVQATT
jgi:DNA-binding MarR family transcriptional regulator